MQPLLMSEIQDAHTRPVTDIHWLPAGRTMSKSTRNGRVVDSIEDGAHTVITVSIEGKCLVWDILGTPACGGAVVLRGDSRIEATGRQRTQSGAGGGANQRKSE